VVVWLVRSAIVLVYAQNNGGLCFHPIGKASGIAMRDGDVCGVSLGMTTARPYAASGDSGTRLYPSARSIFARSGGPWVGSQKTSCCSSLCKVAPNCMAWVGASGRVS
jgi:hypothetical protein